MEAAEIVVRVQHDCERLIVFDVTDDDVHGDPELTGASRVYIS
jgi:hypothetical protein